MQKDIKGMNWGFGVNLSSAHFENGVIVLNNENFEETFNDYSNVLVLFCSPKESRCQNMTE